MKGSIIHIHRARTVVVDTDGMITASELGNYFFSLQNHVFLVTFFTSKFLHASQNANCQNRIL